MKPRRVARPPILRQIALDRHAVVEASAGTGKTFTLEHLIIELVLAQAATLDQVLVVSFTEKATNEIRLRVRAKLEEVLGGGAEPTEAQVASGDFWTIDGAAQERLAQALRSFDGVTIATIHGFCQRVLREQAFASGRLFEEQHVDGRDLFGRSLRDALRNEVARDELRSKWLGAALGAGRSVVQIEDFLWKCVLSRGELRPEVDLAALDRALAAFPAEMILSSSDWAAPIQRSGVAGGTAKAIARRLYAVAQAVEEARGAEGAPRYAIAVGDRADYLMTKLPGLSLLPGPVADACAAALELARATPTLTAALAAAVLPAVLADWSQRKREAGQYDFDDMLLLVDGALSGARGRGLASSLRERWRYVLIDEFQDTDETQWSIFRRAFFERSRAERSVLCLVGDPKQSIYRFRGADVETYLRARDEVLAAGGQLVALDQNFRATPALVAATNALFDPGAPAPLFSGPIAYVEAACGRAEGKLVDGAGRELTPVHVMRCSGAADLGAVSALAGWIAQEVARITDRARPWRLDDRRLGAGDVFVLTRSSREGRTIGAALRQAGIAHTFYKQDGLFQTDEAREVRTVLLAVDDPDDRARRLAAWLTPFFGLPLASIERARDLPPAHPLVACLHGWKALADERDFDRLVDRILADSGVIRREIFFGEDERSLTNYLHVFELLLEHAHRARPSLRELVHTLSGLIERTRLPLDLEGNVQRVEGDRPSVQIMTIHKAKGLQAPIVFVAGGLSPGPSDEVRVYHEGRRRLAWVGRMTDPEVEARVKTEEREEDQRLMYVALTRAQGRLYLPHLHADAPSGSDRAEGGGVRGSYQIVNRRVGELLRQEHALFSSSDVPSAAAPAAATVSSRLEAPPPLQAALLRDERPGEYAAKRRAHAGAFVTSYTRMKARSESEDRPLVGRTSAQARVGPFGADEAMEGAPLSPRGGRASGVFLHELLERVPLEAFEAEVEFERWRVEPRLSRLFEETAAAHGVDRPERERAEEIVWRAWTTPLILPNGERLERLGRARSIAREMDFVFPLWRDSNEAQRRARGSDERSRPGRAEARGYVRGSIDLAFEHGGRVFFVDWKSDSLRAYDRESTARQVSERYASQARLYALAICRLLDVHSGEDYEARFGGMLYCFLRGLAADGRGVWSGRPSWAELVAWESELSGVGGGSGEAAR